MIGCSVEEAESGVARPNDQEMYLDPSLIYIVDFGLAEIDLRVDAGIVGQGQVGMLEGIGFDFPTDAPKGARVE